METVFDAGILLLCVGALVLVALVAFVFRALARPPAVPPDPMYREPVDLLDAVPPNVPDVETYGSVPATGARDYEDELARQELIEDDVIIDEPGLLDRDRPAYDRDAGDIDDEAYRNRRRDDEVL